jgi:uncharacterized membrane protein
MIPWYIFAFIAAIFSGIVLILQKNFLKFEKSAEYSTQTSVIIFIMSLVLLPFAKISSLNLNAAFWMFIASLFGSLGFLLISKALKHSKISTVAPLVNFGPLFTALVAFLILGESLNIFQIVGIGLLLIGAYVLEIDHKIPGVLAPFKKIFGSKYNLFLLFGVLCYSFSGTTERFVLTTKLDPLTAIIVVHFFFALNFLIYELIRGKKFSEMFVGLKDHKGSFLLIALLMLSHRTLAYYAVQLTTAVALVAAIKRMGSFIATLFGGRFFHEDGILRKSLACLILIVGAVLIVVF